MFGAAAFHQYMKSKHCKHDLDENRQCKKCGSIICETTQDFVDSVMAQVKAEKAKKKPRKRGQK